MPNFAGVMIGGQALTRGQVLTLHAALNNFAMDLNSDGLGDDPHGKAMVVGYLANIHDMQRLLLEKPDGG